MARRKKHSILWKALGRPPNESLSPKQERKSRREQGMRNQIESKFGQGKNAYHLNRVRPEQKESAKIGLLALCL
jgi:hypothetical protein